VVWLFAILSLMFENAADCELSPLTAVVRAPNNDMKRSFTQPCEMADAGELSRMRANRILRKYQAESRLFQK
jgi:hypothetical protein